MQLLNLFPLDGLEISLRAVSFKGVSGIPRAISCAAEAWVQDISGEDES